MLWSVSRAGALFATTLPNLKQHLSEYDKENINYSHGIACGGHVCDIDADHTVSWFC